MITLDPDFYDTLAQELITMIVDDGQDDGAIEIEAGAGAEAIFCFYNVDYTLSRGINSMGYFLLAFKNGKRDSTDFCPEKLDEKITL